MKNICVFGDSIAWGAWDYEHGGWVERLKKYFFKENDDYAVYNSGVSGDTTLDLLHRFEIECEAREPSVIIISIGLNDSSISLNPSEYTSPGISLEKYGKNIRKLIESSKKFTNKIILLGLSPADELKTKPVSWVKYLCYTNKNIEIYSRKLRQISESENVIFLDLLGLLNLDDLEDGLHLNSKGHEKIFNHVRECLIEEGIK